MVHSCITVSFPEGAMHRNFEASPAGEGRRWGGKARNAWPPCSMQPGIEQERVGLVFDPGRMEILPSRDSWHGFYAIAWRMELEHGMGRAPAFSAGWILLQGVRFPPLFGGKSWGFEDSPSAPGAAP